MQAIALSSNERGKKGNEAVFEGRTSTSLMQRLGKRYHVTNYEVTLGQNGWHPHHHILVFSDKKLDDDFFQLRDDMARHWINCCKKSGLPLPSMEHGLHLVYGKTAQQVVSQYLCKWGVEHEMTKGHTKQGKEGGLTPFDLLVSLNILMKLSMVESLANGFGSLLLRLRVQGNLFGHVV